MVCGETVLRHVLYLHPARSLPEQRLLPVNPLRDCLIDPSHRSQVYWFPEQALALPWAGTKAISPYLGRLLPQYSYPFCSVLYISSVPAAGLGVYPHYLAEAQDEPHVSSRNKL